MMKSKKYDATNDEKLIDILNFNSFREMQESYPNAVDLSNSKKKSMSYQEVTEYLKSIVNDVMVTTDGDKIAISDDFNHIEKSSDYGKLNRRGRIEIKTYAAEIFKLITNALFEKEIINKDNNKIDVERFKYYSVPVWINNRTYSVLLECAVLKEEAFDYATRNGASNDTYPKAYKQKFIRKKERLQVVDISYLYNIKNRPIKVQKT